MEVHFSKGRHVYGDDAKPFEVQLAHQNGFKWEIADLDNTITKTVLEIHENDPKLSLREIAKIASLEHGVVSHSTVNLILKREGKK